MTRPFDSPLPTTPWVGIAFRHAKPHARRDQIISFLTHGPFVHTEVLLADKNGAIRTYSAFDGVSGFTPSKPFYTGAASLKWTTLAYPLAPNGGYERAYAIILQIIALSLPYNSRDLWQCCFQAALPFERDLDCCHPSSWTAHGVFCSQVALLIMRRLAREGLLALPHPTIAARIEATNSRGCSPNQLFRILASPTGTRAPTRKPRAGG